MRDIRLAVGMLEQVVAASAERALVETPSVESTVTREQLDQLPLNGRDYNQLVLLAAGAVDNGTSS